MHVRSTLAEITDRSAIKTGLQKAHTEPRVIKYGDKLENIEGIVLCGYFISFVGTL